MENPAEQILSHVTRSIANHPTAITAGAVTAIASVMIIRAIHQKMTEVKPLNKEDLRRHENLIKAKKRYFPSVEISDDWLLTSDKKPPKKLNFEETGKNLKNHAQALNVYNSPDHDARATMLDHIGDLFISISKRSNPHDYFWPIVRDDGVEIMFYTDLAAWLLDIAPNLTLNNADSVAMYGNQLDYCKTVDLNVINNQASEIGRNNPSATLQRLITILKNYHNKLHSLNNARGFNSLITEVDNELLGMSARSLNILYLLIDPEIPSIIPTVFSGGVFASNTFMIDRFVQPEANDKKMEVIRNTQLGQWLFQTLDVAGLTYSKFEPTKSLSLREIKKHLRGQHPVDGPDYFPSTVRSGLRPLTEKEPSCAQKEEHYLLKIRALHRLTLELYHLSQCLIKGSKVTVNFGDIWMYGNPGGQATLVELLDHIKDVTGNYINEFQEFWRDFYTTDFLQISRDNNLNRVHEKYESLTHIEVTIKVELTAIKNKIDALIKEIQRRSINYANNSRAIDQSKIDFMSSVLECRTFYKKTGTVSYIRLKNELQRVQHHHSSLSVETLDVSYSENKASVSMIPKDNRLSLALDCLTVTSKVNCKFTDKYNVVPDIPGNQFYSDLQERVFHKIIEGYHRLVNKRFFSGSIWYKEKQFSELRYRYMCLFDAFTVLYSNESSHLSRDNIAEFKQENKDAIGVFDLVLTKFMLRIDYEHLLFTSDSLSVLPEVFEGKQDAIQIDRNTEGGYTVERNARYENMGLETMMSDIKETNFEESKKLSSEFDELYIVRNGNQKANYEHLGPFQRESLDLERVADDTGDISLISHELSPISEDYKTSPHEDNKKLKKQKDVNIKIQSIFSIFKGVDSTTTKAGLNSLKTSDGVSSNII